MTGSATPTTTVEPTGFIGVAVCKTGLCTWVDLTDCMITGDWVLACLADHGVDLENKFKNENELLKQIKPWQIVQQNMTATAI